MDPWRTPFVETLRRSGLSRLTVRAYAYAVDRFVRWWEQERRRAFQPEHLTAEDLLQYRQHLLHVERLRPATVNQRIQALRQFGRWAHGSGALGADPTRGLRSVRVGRRRQPVALSLPEVHALLRAAGLSARRLARRNYALVQLLLQTGLRVGEVVRLRLGDVTVRERSGVVRVRYGKGEKDREVPLNASVRRALRLLLEVRQDAAGTEALFLSDRGGPLSERTVQKLLTELARRAHIERMPVTPRVLRHTFATQYLRDHPGKLVELADLLGHESVDTTAVYTRPSLEELAQDLEAGRYNLDAGS